MSAITTDPVPFFLSLRTHVRIMEAVHQVQIPVVFVQAVWSLVIYLTVDSVYRHLMLIYQLCGHAVSLPLNWMQCATHVYFHCLQDHSYLSQKGPQRNPKGRYSGTPLFRHTVNIVQSVLERGVAMVRASVTWKHEGTSVYIVFKQFWQ